MSDAPERKIVMITRIDCVEVGRVGLAEGSHSMVVDGGQMADPDLRESIDAGLPRLDEIVDPCP